MPEYLAIDDFQIIFCDQIRTTVPVDIKFEEKDLVEANKLKMELEK